jgi:hypothetical protein
MTLATSSPAVTQRIKAVGLSFNQTALPYRLMQALFCSCAWLTGNHEKTFAFCTLKQSSQNILDTEFLWTPSRKFSHVLQMHWNSPGLVYVVHGMESSDQFCQGIKNMVKDACLKT